MTTPKKAVTKKAARLNLEDVVVGEVSSAPGAFNNGLPADHPLTVAFDRSVEENGPVHIATSTPDLAKALLRRLAVSRKLGLDSKVGADGLTFVVRPLRPRTNKPKVEVATDPEL